MPSVEPPFSFFAAALLLECPFVELLKQATTASINCQSNVVAKTGMLGEQAFVRYRQPRTATSAGNDCRIIGTNRPATIALEPQNATVHVSGLAGEPAAD